MEKEEFKSRILDNFKIRESKKADVLLNEMIKRSITVTMASAIAAAGFNAEYSHELKGMLKDIEDTYLKAGYEIPATDDVIGKKEDTDFCAVCSNRKIIFFLGYGCRIHAYFHESVPP